jgi:GNAT superfamily N-acetyltransferase
LKLSLLQAQDLDHLQDLYQRCPDYFQAIGQAQILPDEARQDWGKVPPGSSPQDLWALGLWERGQLDGYVEMLRGYPSPEVAYLGLLMVCQSRRGQGLARHLWQAALNQVRQWPQVERIRLAVVETNLAALRFWPHLGFQATGEIKAYTLTDGHQTQVHLYELRLFH